MFCKVKCFICENFKQTSICGNCLKGSHCVCPQSARFGKHFERLTNVKLIASQFIIKHQLIVLRLNELYDLKSSLFRCWKKTALMKRATSEKREILKYQTIRLAELRKKRKNEIRRLIEYEKRVKKVQNEVLARSDTKLLLFKQFRAKKNQLKNLQRLRILQTRDFIFPIDILQCSEANASYDRALGEDLSASFDSKYEPIYASRLPGHTYSIVYASLPKVQDFTAYALLISSTKKDEVSSSFENWDVTALKLTSLLLATHLLNVIALFQNHRLPFRLKLNDFLKSDSNTKQLSCKIARLNANILYLCHLNRIEITILNPTHTLENLHYFVHRLQTNEFEENQTCETMTENVKNDFKAQLEDALETCLDSDSESEEDDLAFLDWENVPQIQNADVSGNVVVDESQFNGGLRRSSSFATEIVSSAAASIAGYFKGWSNK